MKSTPASSARQPVSTGLMVSVLLAAATATGFLLNHDTSLASQALVYVLAVVIASYTLSLLASVGCALGAVTAFNFFFVPPRWTFSVDSQEHLIALSVMLLVALSISHLSTRLRRETQVAGLNAKRAQQLQAFATSLSSADSAQDLEMLGQQALEAAFDGPVNLVLLQADGRFEPGASLDSGTADGLQSCMREAAALGPGTGRWPGLNAWYLPLGNQGHMQGAVCIQDIEAADTQGREHALALCALLTQALWRLKLAQAMRASRAETQRQQVQSTFLAAISHDLRTPLAAVVGAATALQTQGDKLGVLEQERLLQSIVSEASYLSTLTENTLQLVQLTNPAQPVKRDWESMEEIVGAVLARLRLRDPNRRIRSRVPDGLPLIQADPVLLAQLLANLLDNALTYSQEAIDLVVSVHGDDLLVSVKDRGQAIPVDRYQAIFEPYSRNDHSGQRGAGLGLALCRTIATAHGGRLTLRQRQGGGNSFTFAMPIEPQPPQGDLP